MRILYLLATAITLLLGCPPGNSQIEIRTDLKYLRGLPTAPRGATIHGSVFRYTTPENPAPKAIRAGFPRQAKESRFEAQVKFARHL